MGYFIDNGCAGQGINLHLAPTLVEVRIIFPFIKNLTPTTAILIFKANTKGSGITCPLKEEQFCLKKITAGDIGDSLPVSLPSSFSCRAFKD